MEKRDLNSRKRENYCPLANPHL